MSKANVTRRQRVRSTLQNASAFLKTFRRSKMGVLGLAIIVFFIALALLAGPLAPYPPKLMGAGQPFEVPSAEHWLGTDDVGEDLYSQLLYGTRVSLMVGFVAAFMSTIIGTMVGLISGYFGGKLDEFFMRVIDVLIIIPGIPLMLLLAAYLGPSIWNIIFILVFFGWTTIGRVVRSQTLALRELPFIESARASGAGDMRIMFTDLMPNLVGIIVPQAILSIVGAILGEAGLSFLGLGDPTNQSWGLMLYYAESYGAFLRSAWWWIIPPGLCITLVGIGFTFVGYALNDIFNPRLRRRGA